VLDLPTKQYTHHLYANLTEEVKSKVKLSLITSPFPPPVFDHLQYANMEEEGLGDLVTCGTLSRQRVGCCLAFTLDFIRRPLFIVCDVIAHDQISQAFPLCISTGGGTAWEQG